MLVIQAETYKRMIETLFKMEQVLKKVLKTYAVIFACETVYQWHVQQDAKV
jgi:hypothetical protein